METIRNKVIENERFPQERALYGARGVTLRACRFEGEEDGESALKECGNISAQDCKYPARAAVVVRGK